MVVISSFLSIKKYKFLYFRISPQIKNRNCSNNIQVGSHLWAMNLNFLQVNNRNYLKPNNQEKKWKMMPSYLPIELHYWKLKKKRL